MIGGISFQPGGEQSDPYQSNTARTSPATNVQEAIKILSLRLPKVVGAQAVSPQALLSSQGSGGNPRVDSVVNTVLARMFPTAAPASPMPTAPMIPSGPDHAPSFSGGGVSGPRMAQPSPQANPWDSILQTFGGGPKPPRISVDLPQWNGDTVGPQGDFTVGADGRPMGGGQSMIGGELPSWQRPPEPVAPPREDAFLI
jgi:hypothetical protein